MAVACFRNFPVRSCSSEFHSLMISSTVLPVISDGNFGVVVTAVLTLELVPLLEATTRDEDV